MSQAVTMTLTTVWLNDVADPSDYLSLPFMSTLSWSPKRAVTVTVMSDGSFTAEVDPTVQDSAQVTVQAVTPADVAWLRAHAGRPVWVRDDVGSRLAAVYEPPQITRHQYDADADVTLTLTQVTVDESV